VPSDHYYVDRIILVSLNIFASDNNTMMKYLLVLLSSTFLSATALTYCGFTPCIVPLALSCEELVADYDFQGSCCSLEDIPGTGGCRVRVAGKGNCAWTPKCGLCDPANKCNEEQKTDSEDVCEESIYDPLGQISRETSGDDTNSTNATMPSFFPSMAPTCSPTSMPSNEATNAPVSGAMTSALTASLSILATIYTFCFLF
jgi:hypothetical protein